MKARAALADRFAHERRSIKTWVVDVHPTWNPDDFIPKLVGSDGKVTREDSTMWRIDVDDALELFVDALTPRYWRFHSWSDAGRSGSWINRAIEHNSTLDRAWLPAGHLRAVGLGMAHTSVKTDFGGRLRPDRGRMSVNADGDWADEVYELLAEHDELGGMTSVDSVKFTSVTDNNVIAVREKVDRDGRFLADGTDFKAHERHVSRVVRRYRELIELIEARALTTSALPSGGYHLSGSPITLRFPAVDDMDYLLEELFSCREPFRLFGNPREADGHWSVEASDLHIGQRITLDIGNSWLRAYIRDGVCGNTVVRLASNLEHHLDARVYFSDPTLQSAFSLEGSVPAAA